MWSCSIAKHPGWTVLNSGSNGPRRPGSQQLSHILLCRPEKELVDPCGPLISLVSTCLHDFEHDHTCCYYLAVPGCPCHGWITAQHFFLVFLILKLWKFSRNNPCSSPKMLPKQWLGRVPQQLTNQPFPTFSPIPFSSPSRPSPSLSSVPNSPPVAGWGVEARHCGRFGV